MRSTTKEWQESDNELNRNQPESILTYDHMSQSDNFLYLRNRAELKPISRHQLLTDIILMIIMLSALLLIGL